MASRFGGKRARLGVLVIALALAAIMLLPNSALGTETQPATAAFSFPYIYGQPTVPGTVGAHGTQGPTAGGAEMGPHLQGSIGPAGLPAIGYSISSPPSHTLEVQILNGTTGSSVPSSHATAVLENTSTGSRYSAIASANGFLNLTVPAGNFVLNTTNGASFIPFVAPVDLLGGVFIHAYMPPIADDSINVANGPVASDTSHGSVEVLTPFTTVYTPGQEVDLLNDSNGDAILARAVSGWNGTVYFGELNPNYAYKFTDVAAEANYFTGYNWHGVDSQGTFGQSGYPQSATSWSGTTITGGSISGSSISPTGNMIFQGGTMWLGAEAPGNSLYTFTFSDVTVFLNSTFPRGGFYNCTVFFKNSTVVWRYPTTLFYQYRDTVTYDNSTIIGTTTPSSGMFSGAYDLGFLNASVTKYSYVEDSIQGTAVSPGSLDGRYLNDVIANIQNVSQGPGPGFSFIHCQLTNVSDLNTAAVTAGSADYINSSRIENSDLLFGSPYPVIRIAVDNSILDHVAFWSRNETWTFVNSYVNLSYIRASFNTTSGFASSGDGNIMLGLGDLTSGSMNMTQSYLSLVQSPYVNLAWQKAQAPIPLCEGKDCFWLVFPFHTSVYESIWNFSRSPGVNLTSPGEAGWFNFTQSELFANYTLAQYSTGMNNLGSFVMTIGQDSPNANVGHYNISHSLWDMVFGSFNPSIGGAWYEDIFPWTFSVFGYAPTQYNSNSQNRDLATLYSNDIWEYMYWNWSIAWAAHNVSITGQTNVGYQNFGGNPANLPPLPTFVNFSHDTFLSYPFGAVPNVEPATWLLLGQFQCIANVSSSLFENNPTYALGQTNAGVGYGADVLSSSNSTLYEDWFLNLSNATLPLSKAFQAYWGGNHRLEDATVLAGSRFFYRPTFDESYIGTTGLWSRQQNTTGSSLSYPGWVGAADAIPENGTMGFEIPIWPNATLSASGQGQLVFNTTDSQYMAPAYTYNDYLSSPSARAWSWGVAPDVSVSTGTPAVSYSNGFAGGPQPAFLWGGFNYSTSVEPTYVSIGANSTSAPPVTVAFGGLNVGEVYVLEEYNSTSGALINGPANQYVYPNLHGWINVTYDPATMPTDPTIFALDPANSIGAIAGGTGSFVLILSAAGGVILLGTAFGAYLVATNRREDGP